MFSVSLSSSSSTSTSISTTAATKPTKATTVMEEQSGKNETNVTTPTGGELQDNSLETKDVVEELVGVELGQGEGSEEPWENFTPLSPVVKSIPQVLESADDGEIPECLHVNPVQPPNHETAEEVTAGKTKVAADSDAAAVSAFPQPHPCEAGIAATEQVQPTAVGVLPHRVFSKEEVKALMDRRRERERELMEQEELRLAASRGSSFRGSLSMRGSISGISSMRTPSADASTSRHLYSVASSAVAAAMPPPPPPPPPTTTRPLAYHVSYPAASLSSSCTDFPSPPPYSHIFTTESAVATSMSGRPRPLQSQPTQAVCAPWNIPPQPPYVGFSQPYPTPSAFDPATMLRIELQQQQQQPPPLNNPSAPILPMPPIPQPPQGGMMGMSMQELGVLARLIVLAQSEQQQQQQQLQQQQQQLFYYQAGKHRKGGNILNSPNQSRTSQINLNVPMASGTMQDFDLTSAANDKRGSKNDSRMGAASEYHQGTHS